MPVLFALELLDDSEMKVDEFSEAIAIGGGGGGEETRLQQSKS